MAERIEDLVEDGYEVGYYEDGDEEEGAGGSPVWDEEHNVLRVLKEKCSTCIYGPQRFVQASTVRAMEQETREGGEAGHVQCHHTLPTLTGKDDVGAICRGWWDRNAMRNWLFRMAKRDNVVQYVEEPPLREGIDL